MSGMLIPLIMLSLLALLVASLGRVTTLPPAFWAHLVLALAVLPLISAAMLHFAPVLTRTAAAGKPLRRLPLFLLTAGALAVATFAGWIDWRWLSVAAGLVLLAVIALLVWMLDKARQTLGHPHSGLYWYIAALACLALALVAALMIPLFPDWHGPLRAFHLHLNLYGFVALTAVGTLQVLLPTAAGTPDPDAALRLRKDLKWSVAGALGLALGAAHWPLLGWLGAAAWGWILLRLLYAWSRRYSRRLLALHGAEPLLAAATLGLCVSIVAVPAGISANSPLLLFLPAFLMPLLSGAASVLAPVWRTPHRAGAHTAGRATLSRWGGLRALLFLTAAALSLLGLRCSLMPALLALAWFVVLFIDWLWRDEATH